MKRILLLALMTACTLSNAIARQLTPGTEYFIVHDIYDKALGSSEDGTSPALSAFTTNGAEKNSYVFVAESSGSDGYVLLRQKSTGRYLASSTSNTWSIVFQETKGTGDAYLWKADEGLTTYLQNKRKSSAYVGIDGAQKGKDYVSIYYDKPKGSHAVFRIIPTTTDDLSEAQQTYEPAPYTNAIGRTEVDYYQLADKTVDRDDDVDIHVTANDNPIVGTTSSVNLGSLRTWLIFDNIVPTTVISKYLRYVTIGGKKASNGTNCRVAIYLNGAVVIPLKTDETLTPMTLFDGNDCTGNATALTVKNTTTLGAANNAARSFVLRRGYMATVGTDQNGKGYTRVYVADHADLVVNELPTALNRRISSVNVKPWPYLSKKGMGNKNGSSGADKLRATWFWSWSAGYSSSTNFEYVPCQQHRYWPSSSEVNSKTATASLSLNEPEHSEQHTSDKCSCGGTTDPWTAYTYNNGFLAGGGRIGSPQPTDLSYLTEYFKNVDNMASRCDFAVTHSYWDLAGMNETEYANWYCNTKCKSVWENTGRPLWITEFNISASWNSNQINSYEQHRKYMQVLLQKVEECPWIERYAVYLEDKWTTYMFYNNNPNEGLTPAGQVYRDHRSTFAYNSKYTKVPTWWAPSAKEPSLRVSLRSTGQMNFIVTNPNMDMTDELIIERQVANGEWTEVTRLTDRSKLDTKNINFLGVDVPGVNMDTDHFRVTVTTLNGKTVHSGEAGGLLANPNITATSKTEIEGWTCTKDAQNGYTKESTGDTYFEVWHPTASEINFNYYQDVVELENGIYSLSANVFNSTNNVEGATINGAVGLYAQTSERLYFSPVTEDSELDTQRFNTIDNIVVTDGKLRVGIRNLGTMSGRWAGADNFLLVRTGSIGEVDIPALQREADEALYKLMPVVQTANAGEEVEEGEEFIAVPRDASRFIVNPDANKGTNYGWTTSNVGFNDKNESYDGNASNHFWNIWKSGAFESSMSQDVAGLPEGAYTFSALLRGQNTATMTLTASTPATDGNAVTRAAGGSVSAVFTGIGNTSDADAEFPQGWKRVTTPAIYVGQGQTLTLALNVATTATAWWSADHFGLTLTELPVQYTAIGDVQDGNQMSLPREKGIIYDLSGKRVLYPALKAGTYIIDGKKVYLR